MSAAARTGPQRACRGRLGRRLRAAAVTLALLSPGLAGASASAKLPAEGTALAAPALTAGPVITEAGLVWESAAGVLLTRPDGTTVTLALRGQPNWDNLVDEASFGWRWWVITGREAVLGGRIGGRLRALPALAHCDPGAPFPSYALFAVSGEDLYAALPHSCRHAAATTLLRIGLRTGRARVLARWRAGADSIAAAGGYVAVSFTRGPPRGTKAEGESQVLVRLLDARSGRLVRQIVPPAGEGDGVGLQLDPAGDVLGGCCGREPTRLAQTAQPPQIERYWVAPAGSTRGEPIQLGRDPVLSDRRIAYRTTDQVGDEAIDVRDLRGGTTLTAVLFSGTTRPGAFSLNGDALAWEQQSYVEIEPTPNECRTLELSEPQLESADLRSVQGAPLVIAGPPAPPHRECTLVIP